MGKKKVLFIGRLPPPAHGAANRNELYVTSKLLNNYFKINSIQINLPQNLNQIGEYSFKKLFWTASSYFYLLKKLIFFNPDLIYFEIAPKCVAFYRDSIYVLICKLFNKKILFQFHAKGVKTFANTKMKKAYYRFIFRKAKTTILSNILYYDIQEIIPREDVYILPSKLKDEIAKENFQKIIRIRKQNNKPKLLFLSHMIESKGVIDVLKICNKLKKQSIKFNCYFVGKFQDMNFKYKFVEKIKKYKLEEYCEYLGAKYGKEKQKILETTDYLIFPTKYPEEILGVVILEAFMYGIPVLSYDNGTVRETISKDYLGFFSEKSKWEELATELFRRLDTKENPKKIREHFKKFFASNVPEKGMLGLWQKEII